MAIFERMQKYDHEQVIFCYDKTSGLKAIIAIHNTSLGPALGGTRMWNFRSEEEALTDVLRLSRGMTYKAAAAGLNLGGGKSVILADPKAPNREEIFRAFGRFVNSLNGRYITAEDVGTTVEDMEFVYQETKHVTGIMKSHGGSGDPSPFTAHGTFVGIKASAREAFGSDEISGMTVAIQGCGHVGYFLAKELKEEGCKLIVTDIDDAAVKRIVDEFGATAVAPDEIYGIDAEIFAPCALGAIVNDDTIHQFKFKIIAGSSNNQLREERHGDMLKEKGIVYAPDYVINGGGLINVSFELDVYDKERAQLKTNGIYDTLLRIYDISRKENIPSYKAADHLAESRIKNIGKITSKFVR